MPPEVARALESKLDEWRRSVLSNRPSLFPPFAAIDALKRNAARGLSKKLMLGTGVATVAFGLFGFVTHLLFREYVAQSNPFTFAMAFALFPSCFFLAVMADRAHAHSRRRAIEKLEASGRVEMV